jgi:hypothetical protein
VPFEGTAATIGVDTWRLNIYGTDDVFSTSAHAVTAVTLCCGPWQQCPTVNTSTAGTISFLRTAETDSSVTSTCVIAGIKSLQYVRAQESIKLLVEYLDFKRPPDLVATGSNSDAYPAVTALFTIGRPALSALVRVIPTTSSSNVARDNAVEAIMAIYRDDPHAGIGFLLREAARSQDSGERASLRQAASSALRWCQDKHRTECESVLSSQ